MSDSKAISQPAESWPQLSSGPLITGGTMAVGGAVIAFVGLAVAGWHIMTATRQWMSELETPPGQVARLKWEQAKTAAAAGANSWQQHPNRQVQLSRRRAVSPQ